MEYNIGQISKMFDLSISTIRYYDKEGLLLNLERKSGIRKFTNRDVETLRVIECLKKSGLEIKEIRHFMELCQKGSSTYQERKQIFEDQKNIVLSEIERLKSTLDMLNFKCWYYEMAIKDGNENHLKEIIPNDLPEDIKEIYNRSHNI